MTISNAVVFLALIAQGAESGFDSQDQAREEAKHLTQIRQVTFGPGKAGEGYFSPDGKSIIYQATPPGSDDYQIYTLDLAPGSLPKMVSTGQGKCTCAFFHPDGKSILFASSHLGRSSGNGGKDSEAKRPQEGYNRKGRRYRWDFDPDMDLFRADLNGGHLVRLTDTPGYDAEGSYSPDGKQIIFTSFRSGDAEIYIMDADGENVRRITREKGYDGGPFFSPDGQAVVYRSDRKGNDLLQIYLNNPQGTAERALTHDDHVNWGPWFLPDSKRIVYATSLHGHQNYEIYLMNIETGDRERITRHDGFDGLPVVSPDGKKMLWTSSGRTKDRVSQLFIADFQP